MLYYSNYQHQTPFAGQLFSDNLLKFLLIKVTAQRVCLGLAAWCVYKIRPNSMLSV